MIHRPSTTSPSNEWDSMSRMQLLEVDFFPWILIPPNDDAWVVTIQQKEGALG